MRAPTQPMLAVLPDSAPPLQDRRLVYEPKYDGIRALALVGKRVRGRGAAVHLWSRLGNEKTAQFPEVVAALAAWAGRRGAEALFDGEIVALDRRGEPAGFQALQPRMHAQRGAQGGDASSVALVVFDLLREAGVDLRALPLRERRKRLEAALAGLSPGGALRLGRQEAADGRALLAEAERLGWEGLVVKDADAPYRSGARSASWRKLKRERRQELVVGGWTEPRGGRSHLGALIVGLPDEGGGLRYVGHVGSGLSDDATAALAARLAPLARVTCPFGEAPPVNAPAHWVEPRLVAEVKFSAWTDDGLLRHPVFLGLRDDKRAGQVRREGSGTPRGRVIKTASVDELCATLRELEQAGRDATVTLPGGGALAVTNLGKVFWPAEGLTKGDLLRYYAQVSPFLLPVVAERPLIMRRFPDGVDGPAFYQQRAPDVVPVGVRTEAVAGDTDVPRRLVGGALPTLLYMAQLACISQDPWFSRWDHPDQPDSVAIDLDPMDGVPWGTVLDVALWVRDELAALGVESFPKTSGATGLHVYIPLPAGTAYQPGLLLCQVVATLVARRHKRQASVERAVERRGKTVYVDTLQNIRGKSLATAYSARASPWAGASTPLTWQEVSERVDTRAFTVRTLPARLERVGDLWAGLRRSEGVDLRAVLERIAPRAQA